MPFEKPSPLQSVIIRVNSFAFRPSARRKPTPVVDTREAQMKFGDMKAISSDMFFGKQDNSEVAKYPQLLVHVVLFQGFNVSFFLQYEARTKLDRFSGSSSISSADLFDDPKKQAGKTLSLSLFFSSR